LAWDPSSSPNIAGYRLYSGTTSGVYSQTTEIGSVTSALVSNLVTGKTYFFVVTAYNTIGIESLPSNEVPYLVPSSSPLPTPTAKPTPTPTTKATPTPTPKAKPSSTPTAKLTPTPTAKPTPTPTAKLTPAPTAQPTSAPIGLAVMLSPPPGSTFSSSSVTFNWSAGSATAYFLFVGSSQNGTDIYNSGSGQATVLSETVSNIPTDGRTIYVTLGSNVNGSWTTNSYTYTAFK